MARLWLRAALLGFLLILTLGGPKAYADGKAWQGQWIWDRPPGPDQNAYDYFRKQFVLPAKPQSAIVYVAADSRYRLYVNGYFVKGGSARSTPFAQYYDSYDISPYLQAGPNVIGAIVHFWGTGNERYILGRGGFLFECNFISPNNPSVLVATDASWQVLRSPSWNPSSPRENSSNGYTENYDFNQEPVGWMLPGFNATGWGAPFVIGSPPQFPWLDLDARDIPMLYQKPVKPYRVIATAEVQRTVPQNPLLAAVQVLNELFQPVSTAAITQTGPLTASNGVFTVTTPVSGKDAVIVLDFGQEMVGFPSLTLNGSSGTVVDVSFSEWLMRGTQVAAVKSPQIVNGQPQGLPMYATDRLILRNGTQSWQRFFPTGFRFLQLTIRNAVQPLQILSVGATFTTYPFQANGSFNSSDALLNAIWTQSQYTVQVTTQDAFIDCPWREKGQWMDMSAPMASYYAFGDRAIAARYLRLTSQSQNSAGRLFFPYPSAFTFELPDQITWWGMHLWQYYLHFGDITLLQQLYPVLSQVNCWFQQNLSPRGLLNASWPDAPTGQLWTWIDWGHRPSQNYPASLGGKKGEMAALDLLYYKFLTDASSIAQALGNYGDAQVYQAQAAALSAAINQYYWDPVAGFYWDDVGHTIKGYQASVLAVLYDVAPAGQGQSILNQVMDSQYHVGLSSPSFYFFVLQALAKAGMYPQASAAIRGLWGAMRAQGATTWWEQWNPSLDRVGNPLPSGVIPNVSLAHGYGTSPLYYLSTRVLGVQPTGPGFSTFSVSPDTSSVQWANGTVPTPQGNIAVSWTTAAAGTLSITITAPPLTAASVVLPRLAGDQISVGGQVVWQAGNAISSLAPGPSVVNSTPSQVTIQVPSGTYQMLSQ